MKTFVVSRLIRNGYPVSRGGRGKNKTIRSVAAGSSGKKSATVRNFKSKVSSGFVHKSAGGVAGGGRALGQQPDLDRLRGPAEALRARLLAVLGPAKPAEVRRVDAVPDVVGVGC